VIKVEQPGRGDDSREYGPFIGNDSAYFMSVNRNKECITLNLKSPAGQKAARTLAENADVILENCRPGAMARLKLGYDDLKELNPRLIYASISGFGQDGPWKNNPAYDVIVQGMAGIMSITGNPGGPPVRVGISLGDIAAGLFAAIGILSALYERHKSGQGQMIDVAMLDTQVALLENAVARYLITGEIPGPLGTRHPSITPFAAFTSSDGYVLVGIGNDSLWRRFAEAVGHQELIADPRFATNRSRTDNWEALEAILNRIFEERTTDAWIKLLDENGIPVGPVNTIDKVVANPQIVARHTLVEVTNPDGSTLRMPRMPVKMSRTDLQVYSPAERMGASTRKVLNEVGYSKAEIDEMLESGAAEG